MLTSKKIKYLLFAICILVIGGAQAQTYPFARLTGSPGMDTKGWNLTGDARIGDTNGDNDGFNNEMILCSPTNFNNGACFFGQPVNIAECQKWVAEFDYRIFDGTAADGIAFCFLANPPTGFLQGGNLGIPSRPKGLMVILDTWLNCLGTTPVPKLEIRYADGNTSYGSGTESVLECPNSPQPTSGPIQLLRQSIYNRIKITYNYGNIEVFINNTLQLKGNYKIDFPGYFGLTASTGGSTDRHSIRDFVLYTYKPIVSPPNAGLDRIICSGETTELGVPSLPSDPYHYFWSPAEGLSNPDISNPKVTLTNDGYSPVTYTYFITKDSLTNDTLCAYSDAVQVTVLGKFARAGSDLNICSGVSRQIGSFEELGYSYSWSPATGLSNSKEARPYINLVNEGTTPITYQYIFTAVNNVAGCTDQDTVSITVNPKLANAGAYVQFCSGNNQEIGVLPINGYTYEWSPKTGLDNANKANPTINLTNTTGIVQTFQYIVTATTTSSSCGNVDTDTVQVTVYPEIRIPVIAGPKSICPNAEGIVYKVNNPQTGITYNWIITGGTVKSGQGTSAIQIDWNITNLSAQIQLTASDAYGCDTQMSLLLIKIGVVLETELPFSPLHPDTLCLNMAKGIRYEVNNANGSVYTWGIAGNGVIVSGTGTNSIVVNWLQAGAGKIWVSEQSTTSTNVCFGTSDTLQVLITPLPEAKQIDGLLGVCAFTLGVVYTADGNTSSTYQWQVTGGSIVSTQANKVIINWNGAGTGKVTVKEVTPYGCEGNLISVDVSLYAVPKPVIITQDLAVCPQRFSGLVYQVSGLAGSRFSWQITNGQIISSNADSSIITVNWNETHLAAIRLTVTEISDKSCTGNIAFPLVYDASSIVFKSVSVQPEAGQNIALRFQIKNSLSLPNNFTISRRSFMPATDTWTAVGLVSQLDTVYIDKDLQTGEQSYEYKIEGKDRCNIPLEANFHHSILLGGMGDEKQETVELNWNDYTGWENGVKAFELWRKLDEENDFTPYATVAKGQLMYTRQNSKEGFKHCYKVRAIEEAGFNSHSWSNEVCIEFMHALFIPNVITPNSDGKNDQWFIENLFLYPSHEVLIYNRYGKEVFKSQNYQQNWDGTGLSNGIYYYQVRTARGNHSFSGWVQVLR